MTKEDEEKFKNKNICRFCEEEIISDKVRDHCHSTGENRGTARNNCNINVTQKQSNFSFALHNFSNCDCHLFFKKLADKEKE